MSLLELQSELVKKKIMKNKNSSLPDLYANPTEEEGLEMKTTQSKGDLESRFLIL